MAKIHPQLPLFAALLVLAGCAQQTEVDANKSRLDALEARLVALEAVGANDQKKKPIELEDLSLLLRSKINRVEIDGRGVVSVGSDGYQMIQTQHGPVAVSFVSISPMGAGSKVVLSFVNLSSVDWTNIKLSGTYWNFIWGEPVEEGVDAGFKEFEKRATGNWDPGKQALVTINLPEMSDKEVKSLDLLIEPGGISYKR